MGVIPDQAVDLPRWNPESAQRTGKVVWGQVDEAYVGWRESGVQRALRFLL